MSSRSTRLRVDAPSRSVDFDGRDDRSLAGQALPRISVVTPSLNHADLLDETLTSVLSQGYPSLEYVVVDGGSTDGSVDVIKRHEAGIARWVSEPDKGHADALNKGFAMTTGEIMAWINSTDVYYPWTLSTVADVFCDLPQVQWIGGMPTAVGSGPWPRGVLMGYCNKYDLLLGHESTIQQESVFWRRSLWEQAGGRLDDSLRLACDYELWLRFARYASLHHVSTILAGFRYHDDRRGLVCHSEYVREARAVRDAEVTALPAREKARVAALRSIRRMVGRRGEMLIGRAGVLGWHRYPRVVYDFPSQRWQVV